MLTIRFVTRLLASRPFNLSDLLRKNNRCRPLGAVGSGTYRRTKKRTKILFRSKSCQAHIQFGVHQLSRSTT